MVIEGGTKVFWKSRLLWLILLGAAVFLVLAYGRAYYQNYQIQEEIARLKEDAQKLEAKKIETLDQLEYMKSPKFVEDKARTELNLTKPGETVAIIKRPNANGEGVRQKSGDMLQSLQSNLAKWWQYFFGGVD